MTWPALRAPALSTPMVGIKFQHEFRMGKFTVAVFSPDWRSDSQAEHNVEFIVVGNVRILRD